MACIEVLHKDCEPAVCEVANFDYRESKLYPLVCGECGRVVEDSDFNICFNCNASDYR